MTLIKSISGIRGTIGGNVGDALTPVDAVRFAAAYGTWLKENNAGKLKVIIGRDARLSGQMISDLVVSTLVGLIWDFRQLLLSKLPFPWNRHREELFSLQATIQNNGTH
jgi:phosphomannomutase